MYARDKEERQGIAREAVDNLYIEQTTEKRNDCFNETTLPFPDACGYRHRQSGFKESARAAKMYDVRVGHRQACVRAQTLSPASYAARGRGGGGGNPRKASVIGGRGKGQSELVRGRGGKKVPGAKVERKCENFYVVFGNE